MKSLLAMISVIFGLSTPVLAQSPVIGPQTVLYLCDKTNQGVNAQYIMAGNDGNPIKIERKLMAGNCFRDVIARYAGRITLSGVIQTTHGMHIYPERELLGRFRKSLYAYYYFPGKGCDVAQTYAVACMTINAADKQKDQTSPSPLSPYHRATIPPNS